MTSNRKILTFSGRMRSGKDMLCSAMEKTYGAKTFSLATHLKTLCIQILEIELPCLSPWDYAKLNAWKNNKGIMVEDGLYLSEPSITLVSDYTRFNHDKVSSLCENLPFRNVRELLQIVGTDIIRSIEPDWHIKKTLQDISKLPENTIACVGDVRFKNELDSFRKAGADAFFIIRNNAENISNHESETSLHHYDFTDERIIINNGTVEELCKEFTTEYANGFKNVLDKPIFLSDYTEYSKVKRWFGLEQTPLVDEIIRQNKDRETFLKDGLITFRNNTKFKMTEVIKEMDMEQYYSYSQVGGRFLIDNPIAYENLKIWL